MLRAESLKVAALKRDLQLADLALLLALHLAFPYLSKGFGHLLVSWQRENVVTSTEPSS